MIAMVNHGAVLRPSARQYGMVGRILNALVYLSLVAEPVMLAPLNALCSSPTERPMTQISRLMIGRALRKRSILVKIRRGFLGGVCNLTV